MTIVSRVVLVSLIFFYDAHVLAKANPQGVINCELMLPREAEERVELTWETFWIVLTFGLC